MSGGQANTARKVAKGQRTQRKQGRKFFDGDCEKFHYW
jgi:hypothetical protein